jgi:hypothetical protein
MNEYAANYMVPTATNDSSLDFSQTSEASNTNGVYLRNGTQNDKYPIYYYRGNVNNNLTDSFKVSGIPLSATLTGSFTISQFPKQCRELES